MTLVSDNPVPASSSEPVQVRTTVTAVVYATDASPELDQTLRAAVRGTRTPDRVIVLDASGDGQIAQLLDFDGATQLAVPASSPEQAFNRLLESDLLADQPSMLWFLQPGLVPAADTLQILVDALRRSSSASVVGPKLLDAAGQIRSLGISSTRSGRILPIPHPGEPDQGQHNDRSDVLGIPTAGMLVRREIFQELRGFQPSLRSLGADLDFCWRAHRAGHRVLVAPTATATCLGDTVGSTEALTSADRRDARRVALARCAWWSAPFMALWIALTSVLAGFVLLVGKRPAAAAREVADVGALLTPARLFAVRWYARGTASIKRRDIASLFIGIPMVRRHLGDLVSSAFGRGPAAQPESTDLAQSVADEDADVDRGSLLGRIFTNPGVGAAGLAGMAGIVAARSIDGLPSALTGSGFAGGELLPGRADSQSLFHAWWDGWSGAGFGTPTEASPASALLAVIAWIVGHVPLLGATNTAGVAVAWLIAAAMPLAAGSAYLAGRIATRSRLLRGAVALTYACGTAAVSAVAHGRLGAVVLLIMLPAVLAGCGRLLSTSGSNTSAAATALAAAVLASFVPGALVLTTAVAMIGLITSRGSARLRSLILLVGTPLLLGPWTLTVLRDPVQFLAGPGTLVNGPAPSVLRLLALSPDAETTVWWLAAPVVVLAVAALVIPRNRARVQWALAALALVGVAATIMAPRVSLGVVPPGQSGAGALIHPWWGLPMILTFAALLALVLVGFGGLSLRRSAGWQGAAWWPVAALVGVGALAAPGVLGWTGLGQTLRAWADPRPAIAIDQATGPLSNRTLLLTPGPDGVTQQVLAREAGPAARGLDRPSTDPVLVETIRSLLDTSGGAPAAQLISRGVGFVGLAGTASTDLRTRLDATDGLTRMGSTAGFDYWRVVPPPAPEGGANVGVPRVSVGTPDGVRVVPVTGPNAEVDATIQAAAGDVLNVAQLQAWAGRADVAGAAGPLKPVDADHPAYAVAPGASVIDIATPTSQPWLRGVQILAAIVLGFLAIPAGRRRSSAAGVQA